MVHSTLPLFSRKADAYSSWRHAHLGFVDPIVAELLASSILTILWVPFVYVHFLCNLRLMLRVPTLGLSFSVYVLSGTSDYGFYGSFIGETFGLFCLFILWLVGAAISTVRPIILSLPPFKSWCYSYLSVLHSISGVTFPGATNSCNAVSSPSWLLSHGWDGLRSSLYFSLTWYSRSRIGRTRNHFMRGMIRGRVSTRTQRNTVHRNPSSVPSLSSTHELFIRIVPCPWNSGC